MEKIIKEAETVAETFMERSILPKKQLGSLSACLFVQLIAAPSTTASPCLLLTVDCGRTRWESKLRSRARSCANYFGRRG